MNDDNETFEPNYDLEHHVMNDVTKLGEDSKMKSCTGYKLLELRGTKLQSKFVKDSSIQLHFYKQALKILD